MGPSTIHHPPAERNVRLRSHMALWAEPPVGYCSRRPRPSPMWGSRFVGARAVEPWVGEQKPLGKTPPRGNPNPQTSYLPTAQWVCGWLGLRRPPIWTPRPAWSGKEGGLCDWALGACTPCGAMRWPVLAVFWAYSCVGPRGAASGRVSGCRASPRYGGDIGALQGRDLSEGHAGGNCTVVNGPLVPSGIRSRRGGVRGSRAYCVVPAAPYTVLGDPGRNLPDWRT